MRRDAYEDATSIHPPIPSEGPTGKVCATSDFLHLGARTAIDQALSRLVRRGDVRRVGRGLYDLPRVNPRFNVVVPPAPDQVAAAAARRSGAQLLPSGAAAANMLGLSTQVPAKVVYLTSGDRKRCMREPRDSPAPCGQPEFQRQAPFQRPGHSSTETSGEAFGYGPDLATLRARMTPDQRKALRADARYARHGWPISQRRSTATLCASKSASWMTLPNSLPTTGQIYSVPWETSAVLVPNSSKRIFGFAGRSSACFTPRECPACFQGRNVPVQGLPRHPAVFRGYRPLAGSGNARIWGFGRSIQGDQWKTTKEKARCADGSLSRHVRETVLPVLLAEIEKLLPARSQWMLAPADDDQEQLTLAFAYPSSFSEVASYVRRQIRWNLAPDPTIGRGGG